MYVHSDRQWQEASVDYKYNPKETRNVILVVDIELQLIWPVSKKRGFHAEIETKNG